VNVIIALFIGISIAIAAGLIRQRSQGRKIANLERIQDSLGAKIEQLEKILRTQRRKIILLEQSQLSLAEKISNIHIGLISEPPHAPEARIEPDDLVQTETSGDDNNKILADEPHPPDDPIKTDNTEIIAFLQSKGIEIKSIPPEQSDEVLGQIAIFMGNRYSLIEKFYRNIKSTLSSGKTFIINLKDAPQEQVATITHLANRLHRIAFLEEYNYRKSPQFILSARPNRIPPAINFLTGQWLERFVKEQIIELLESLNLQISYSYLLNPKIILPNGDDFELDIMFKIGQNIFWFEAKTGDYQKHIHKYSKMASILGLNREHAYIILTDIEETLANELSSVFPVTVVNVEGFAEHFEGVLTNLASNIS